MSDTGHGTTISFLGGFTAKVRMVTPPEFSIPSVDTTHLGTAGDFMTCMPGDLQEISEVDLDWQFDPDEIPPVGVTDTITLTFPIPEGKTNGATLIGTGFINKWKPGELKTNELMTAKGSVKFDGVTGPAFTASS